ncbi:hypothetical protein, partial [Microvirga alba]|nr:hypothetical protein [Microvirga alba]
MAEFYYSSSVTVNTDNYTFSNTAADSYYEISSSAYLQVSGKNSHVFVAEQKGAIIYNAGTVQAGGVGGTAIWFKYANSIWTGTYKPQLLINGASARVFSFNGWCVDTGFTNDPSDDAGDGGSGIEVRNVGEINSYVGTAIRGWIGQDTVKNTGTIVGSIQLNGGNDTVDNSATITGAVSLGSGNDRLMNTGTITGAV